MITPPEYRVQGEALMLNWPAREDGTRTGDDTGEGIPGDSGCVFVLPRYYYYDYALSMSLGPFKDSI